MATYSIADYQRSIRASVRGGWAGALNKSDVLAALDSALYRGLSAAWYAGAGDCGISPNELTAEEKAALALLIYTQQGYASGFADAIIAGNKAAGGELQPLLDRAERWTALWDKSTENGKAMACGNKKAKFRLGATEKHCRTCSGLDGRVYRYSVWVANNAVPPKNPHFECGAASYCDCRLEDTDEPITKGRFPKGLLKR